MATKSEYSRGITVTKSGIAFNRATKISGITITAVTADTLIRLRDGDVAGPIVWQGEADNATSSLSKVFNPPLRFFHKLYVEFVSSGSESAVSLEFIEP